jgi:3-oxoacyl-[acyl-carrier-protein] synthase II
VTSSSPTQAIQPAVILGLGAVTGFGYGVESLWNGLIAKSSAIRLVPRSNNPGERWVATVPDVPGRRSSAGWNSRVVDFAIEATREAVSAALERIRWPEPILPLAPGRIGVCVGTSAGVRTDWDITCGSEGTWHLQDSSLDQMNGIAQAIAATMEWSGPAISVNTACSSSASATAVALEWLAEGSVDAVLVCGAEEFTEYSAVGFEMMGAYSEQPCAPFASSDGLTLGEGAGALLLASPAIAKEHTVAGPWVVGYGIALDAYHPTAPNPEGRGLERATKQALADTEWNEPKLGYLNLHGTGTQLNDDAERVFIDRISIVSRSPLVVSGIKGAIGHTLGAAAALELIATVRALETRVAPPTINARGLDASAHDDNVRIVGLDPVPWEGLVAGSVNSAFGGHNTCVLVTEERGSKGSPPRSKVAVAIEAASIVGVYGASVDDWRSRFADSAPPPRSDDPLETPADFLDRPPNVEGREWRRLDRLTMIAIRAVSDVLASAPADLDPQRVALAFATERGPSDSYSELHEATMQGRRVNPALFPRLALTFCPGSVSQLLGILGPSITFTSAETGGLAALAYATSVLRRGACDAAIVLAADSVSDYVLDSPKAMESKIRPCECAVALLLRRAADIGRLAPTIEWVRVGRVEAPSDGGPSYEDSVVGNATLCSESDLENVAVRFTNQELSQTTKRATRAITIRTDEVLGSLGAASGLVGLAMAVDSHHQTEFATPASVLSLHLESAGGFGAALLSSCVGV